MWGLDPNPARKASFCLTAIQGPSTDYLDKLAAAVPGGADGRMNNLSIFLPDAVVSIGVWARIDPQLVLEALSPVQ